MPFSISRRQDDSFFCCQQRQQRAQRRGAVADHVDFHRIAQAQPAAVDVDLHAARGTRLGQKFAVGKGGAHHQEGVAILHQVPAWLGPEQPDRAGDERQIVRQCGLAEQRLGDAGLQAAARPRSPHRSHRARRRRPAWRLCLPAVQNVGGRAKQSPRRAIWPAPHNRHRYALRRAPSADPRIRVPADRSAGSRR